MVAHHPRDHLSNRLGLALSTRNVIGRKPIETASGVVRPLLLRQQQRETILLGERRPVP
jgi:hypothetical protein